MRYLSVCSGIEAATVAWRPLGWKAVGFAEIDKFPSAVLAHHYPEIRNFGDFTSIRNNWLERIGIKRGSIDLLAGGTPCQDFSIAGLRAGVAGERGNLTLEFLRLAQRLRPRWMVWENVPGVYSATSHDAPDQCPPEDDLDGPDGPRDGQEVMVEDEYNSDESHAFACFLAGLQELGYGFAYRTLDAQYFGVPQRRRRVFVVGHLGDWRRAAAVLFERKSLSGDSAPRREARETAPTIPARRLGGGGLGTDFDCDGGLIAFGGNNTSGAIDVATAVNAHGGSGRMDFESETFIAHALRGEGFDASEDGTGRGTPLVPVAFDCKASGRNGFGIGEVSPTLRSMGHLNTHQNAGGQVAVAFNLRGREGGAMPEVDDLASMRAANGGSSRSCIAAPSVRRMTPLECERLQGFPDYYTKIGDKTADGPRYKAIGNSMAVPVMAWIGQRIATVEAVGGVQ